MDWKTPAVLSLLVLAPLVLGAAAAPPGDCAAGADSGQVMPIPLDLTGRPNAPPGDAPFGLAGQTFAPQPEPGAGTGCPGPLPSTPLSATLRSESGDVLHGLPMPDSLRPIDEPKRAPDFQ
jgi:hypothetical protein